MFRLTRVYSIASFLGIALVAVALSLFYRMVAVSSLSDHETLTNAALTKALSNTLWPRYADFIARAHVIPPRELAAQPEIASLRQELLEKIRGLRVVKVKIYDPNGLTVYSTEPRQIGQRMTGNAGLQKARAGATVSELVFRDHFSATERVIENRNLLSSYIPVRPTPGGPVDGVFEIYSDVTPLVADIDRTEYTVMGGVTTLLLLLYLFLFHIVRRADRIIRHHESEERKAQQEQIHYIAYHDPLTGLANRALFKDRLQHAVNLAARERKPLGIMFIDVDRFKVINDSLGHESGDKVLIETAKRLRACLRASDTACRIGGDEFTVILENLASADEAAMAAGRLIQKFAESMKINGREIIVTLSIGIAIFPDATKDPQRLLKDADAAMHEAKESGRNRFVFYTQELDARAQESLEFEIGLRQALQNQQFVIHYQPRVNVQSGTVTGVEALLRWQHPERGLIAPDRFIPLLEDTGMIIPAGEWVMQQACRQARRWHDAGHRSLRISVNLSMKQFRAGSLLASVRHALEGSGLSPRSLELELTETVLVDDAERALDLMRELKKIGVSLSIDDFGTGYSSLSYLRHFPIDLLKIDGSFIRDVARNRGDIAITTAIAAMARSLHLGILAEGVETREQVQFLLSIGCHDMQGHLFSEAVAAERIGTVIRQLDVRQCAGLPSAPAVNGRADPAPA
ncbi:MAG TPA: EAL domain-containing protein [Candidatus Methylomirabilis sp.]|nr:EAL domain-containing protein [Candidatus Methylomirabilis sp.]